MSFTITVPDDYKQDPEKNKIHNIGQAVLAGKYVIRSLLLEVGPTGGRADRMINAVFSFMDLVVAMCQTRSNNTPKSVQLALMAYRNTAGAVGRRLSGDYDVFMAMLEPFVGEMSDQDLGKFRGTAEVWQASIARLSIILDSLTEGDL